MDHARHVLREYAGKEREQQIYLAHCNDLDAYINAACEAPVQGLQCSRCKQYHAAIELLQTRSADEGMTAFVVCSTCGHRTKFT